MQCLGRDCTEGIASMAVITAFLAGLLLAVMQALKARSTTLGIEKRIELLLLPAFSLTQAIAQGFITLWFVVSVSTSSVHKKALTQLIEATPGGSANTLLAAMLLGGAALILAAIAAYRAACQVLK